jgi:hypothetical protein
LQHTPEVTVGDDTHESILLKDGGTTQAFGGYLEEDIPDIFVDLDFG